MVRIDNRPSASNDRQRYHDCSLSVVTPTTLLPRERMQSLRHAPHGLRLPARETIFHCTDSLQCHVNFCTFSSHEQSNRLSETVAGRPFEQKQQQAQSQPARRPCVSCQRTITCSSSSSFHTPFHRSWSGLARDGAAAALTRNSWICRRCTDHDSAGNDRVLIGSSLRG